MTPQPKYQIRAVARALQILSCFSVAVPELDLTTISVRVDLPKSTVFRLLSVLEDAHYIERCEGSDRYRVGINTFKAGSAYLAKLTLEKAARPHMEALVATRNLASNLGILSQHEVVYLVIVEPSSVLRYASAVGQRHHIHCSALGKVLAAALPEKSVCAILEQSKMPALTKNTFTDPDAFLAHLDVVRAQGYAIDEEEAAIGVRCIAAPVRDQHGEVVCALSISGPTSFYPAEEMSAVIEDVIQAAGRVSERLGFASGDQAPDDGQG